MKITWLRFYSIVLLLVMISLKASAQLPVPVIECVSFLDENTLRVTWTVTPDPLNDFDGFRIQPYSVNNPGAIIGAEIISDKGLRSWDFPISTPGGPAPDQYKIEIYTFKATPFELSLSSVSRYSIFLEFGASTNEGKAVLNWGQHQSLDGSFTIKRRTATGIFETIGSTTNEYYEDIITAPYCDPTPLYYQVEYSSSLGSCMANSTITSANFFDINMPADPVPTYVTINGDGRAELNWILSPSTDVDYYSIDLIDPLNGGSSPYATTNTSVDFFFGRPNQ